MSTRPPIQKSLEERFAEYLAGPKDNLRAMLIEAVAHHEGWEESALALVDEAVIPAIDQYEADCQKLLHEIFSTGDASGREEEDCTESSDLSDPGALPTSPANPSEMRVVDEKELFGRMFAAWRDAPEELDGIETMRIAFDVIRPYLRSPEPVSVVVCASAVATEYLTAHENPAELTNGELWKKMAKAALNAAGVPYVD